MGLSEIRPCVVGLGKLGLPLAAVIAAEGYKTYGLDTSAAHVSDLKKGAFESPEPGLISLLEEFKPNLNFVTSFNDVKDCDIYFLIVPTPSMVDGKFDNKYLVTAILALLDSWDNLSGQKTIVIVSTVMPGTCAEIFCPIINEWESRTNNNVNVRLLYAPEFIALGTVIHNLRNPDMTLIGCDSSTDAEVFLQIMEKVTKGKPATQVLSLTEAEIVKIMVNCFVTMKISFANFIGEISSVMPGTDKYKISNALGLDSRIGSKYLRPGVGFAGPCFPRDNKALIAFSAENKLRASLSLATDEINQRQPENILEMLLRNFPSVKKVAIAGITYKPYSKVIEESQTVMLAKLCQDRDIEVKLFDPLIDETVLPEFNFAASVIELLLSDVVIVSKEFEFLISEIKDQEFNLLVV
jgi:UDPglucose 6-dehydrogenase